ncbi:MAG TPA: sugar phosphate isomerase/epimerase [Candidatus Latescibacteria bacterium]|nr:sugar phosphate isomerase/epimerase [Candidatus Latescibacterota bacterium]
MFKKAVFTDEVSQDLKVVLKVVEDYNLDGIEIRSLWDKPPQDLVDEIPRLKEGLRDTGLKVCSIASPFFKCDIDSEDEYKEHLDILRRCIKLAQALDCTVIRGFTFWRKGRGAEDYWQRILDKFEEPVKISEQEGMTIGIENEASTMIGTGKVLAEFLKALDHPNVKATWDPANSVYDEHVKEEPYPEGYEAIKPFMVHMHLKDAGKDPKTGELVSVPIGDGVIDYRGQFRALIGDGYEGFVSLETHWRPKALSKEEVDKPGGSKFSESGEYASRVCLDNWFKILEEIRA